MALRCTEEEVKEVIDTTLENEEIVPFHRAASTLIDSTLTDEEYGIGLLKEIEIWLSAHFVAIRDPRMSKEDFGDGKATYHGKSGMGLKATPYGQQVLILDFHGILAAIDEAKGAAMVETLDFLD